MYTPETLIDAVRYFTDLDVCHDYMRRIKWPGGVVTCPACGGDRIGQIVTRKMLRCRDCRKQFSYKVGTIFEDSPLGLDKWFVAVWSVANCKNGISSCELGRALGVAQKTAWFMLHRIREAMKTGTFRKLGGTIEVDETFVGGKAENMHAKRRAKGTKKTIVQGILERGGLVATNDHSVEYVRGLVHTNGIENFWSLLKRAIKGTYTHVAPFHLERYCDEEAFRYNNRKMGDGERFWRVLCGVVGKRLTYRQLCMIGDCGFMGIE